jgi:hypothetical protein
MFVLYTSEQLGENPKLAVLFRAGPSTPNCYYPHVRLRRSIIVGEKPVHADLQSLSRPSLSFPAYLRDKKDIRAETTS